MLAGPVQVGVILSCSFASKSAISPPPWPPIELGWAIEGVGWWLKRTEAGKRGQGKEREGIDVKLYVPSKTVYSDELQHFSQGPRPSGALLVIPASWSIVHSTD